MVVGIPIFVSMVSFSHASEKESFEIKFQTSGDWSKDQYVEYQGNIPQLKEFTSCHWEKLWYFSAVSNFIWAYCSIPQKMIMI